MQGKDDLSGQMSGGGSGAPTQASQQMALKAFEAFQHSNFKEAGK